MEPSGDPPAGPKQPGAADARPRGTTYGRAGARWMVDPEAIWRPGAEQGREDGPYAVLITDTRLDGPGPRIMQSDTGFARLTGYAAAGARGRPLECLHGPRTDRGRFEAAFARVRTGHADAGATLAYRRDGSVFGMAWTVQPVELGAGETTCLVWVLHEIDAERAEGEGDRAAPGPPALVVTAAAEDAPGDGRIVHANDAFTELTGYPREELTGRTLGVLQGPGTPTAEQDRLRRALEGGYPCRVELLHYTRGGRPFWNALDLLPFRRVDGPGLCWLGLAHDVTERRDREQRIYEAAYYDDLTGLPNRALAQVQIERALRLAHRNRGKIALLYLDLDRFDDLRRDYPRPELNDLLSRMATRFADATRHSDTLAYVGADEFLVVAEDIANAEDGRHVAERLCEVAGEPIRIGDDRIAIGVTVGISVYPDHGGDPEQLLQRADAALIQARADGESWGLYSPDRMGARLDRLFAEDALRGAIQRDEFAVALQPIVGLADGRIRAHEALARWHHPEEGWIPPSEFLPRAARRGLHGLITARVQALAFDAVATWRSVLPDAPPRIVLNIAPWELAEEEFVAGLEARLAAAGLPWEAVELDLPAEVLRAGDAGVSAILEHLRLQGVTLALDDCRHPDDVAPLLDGLIPDRLKLDLALVRDVHHEPSRQALVSRLATLAADHGVAISAEGVETAEEAEYLARLGCPSAQGHYFGRPEIV